MSVINQIQVGSTTYDIQDAAAVPSSRTINGKALSSNITLNASDVGAMASTYTAPVTSVNSQTGAVVLAIPSKASDVNALENSTNSAKMAAGVNLYMQYVDGTQKYGWTLATATPSQYCVAKYAASSYLNSATPGSTDNSTKVATTAFVKTAIPTKVSAFTNDSGYLTSYTETDPTVPSWAKESSKPTYTASEVGAVPTTRKVNNKALSSNITLAASDVGAVPTTRKINNKALSSDITLTAADVGALASTYTAPVTSVNLQTGAVVLSIPSTASDVGAVPTNRTVNGKALSSNITLSAADVGALPSTYTAPVTSVNGSTGAVTIAVPSTAADVGAVPTTRTINGHALSSNIALTASDVEAVPMPTNNGNFSTDVFIPTVNANDKWYKAKATIYPEGYRIAKYDGSAYLKSTTPPSGDNSTKVATTSFVQRELASHQTIRLSNVTCNANSAVGDFATVNNAAISSNHVVANIVFSKPNYVRSDVTWTTTDGSLTLNGRCYVAITADIILVYDDVLVS